MNDFEKWRESVRTALYAQTIALLCHEHNARGGGGVTPLAMARFVGEAEAVVEMWQETVMPSEWNPMANGDPGE